MCVCLFSFRIFGGLRDDIKRKIPFYLSDFKDALHIQCFASFIFLYFACLTPIITFGGLLGDATDNNMVGTVCICTEHQFSDVLMLVTVRHKPT